MHLITYSFPLVTFDDLQTFLFIFDVRLIDFHCSNMMTKRVKFFCCFFIQFNVPFKIISHMETSQSIGAAKREYTGKTT